MNINTKKAKGNALLLLTADSFFAVRLLRRSHNIDLLGLKNLWRELHRA